VGYRHGSILYPINYGYLPGIMGGDGEEQDAYILGVCEPVTEFDGQVVAAIHRRNDCEDKLVVAPVGSRYHQGEIAEAVYFQEQFFDIRILSSFERSCGVLPYRLVDGKKEFLLVLESAGLCWSVPRGIWKQERRSSKPPFGSLRRKPALPQSWTQGEEPLWNIPFPTTDGRKWSYIWEKSAVRQGEKKARSTAANGSERKNWETTSSPTLWKHVKHC
jgi:inorganic pyrophosphatase